MEDGDETGVVESAGGTPPVEVLDKFRDEFFEQIDVACCVVDRAEAVWQYGHLSKVVIFVLGVEAGFQGVGQAVFVAPVDLLWNSAVIELETEHRS